MYNEIKKIDRIEIINGNFIQVREATIVTKDGIEIARTFYRWSFNPLDDLSKMPKDIQDIANIVFTDEVKAAYQQSLLVNSVV